MSAEPLRQRIFPTLASFQEEGRKHYNCGEFGWKFRCPKCKCVHVLYDWSKVYPKDSTKWARICLDCGYENPGNYPILVKEGDVSWSCF